MIEMQNYFSRLSRNYPNVPITYTDNGDSATLIAVFPHIALRYEILKNRNSITIIQLNRICRDHLSSNQWHLDFTREYSNFKGVFMNITASMKRSLGSQVRMNNRQLHYPKHSLILEQTV